jgi:hypothetical protein
VGIDGFRDRGLEEWVSRRDVPAVPGLDRGVVPRGRTDLASENAELGRAVGELAAENADLYRRNSDQGEQIERLRAKLDLSEARFSAWAKEMGRREDARAEHEEAQAKREEAQNSRIEELERMLAEQQDAASPGEAERRLENRSATREEAARHKRGRDRPSNEIIAVGVAWTAIALTAVSELKGTPGVAVMTAYLGEGIAAGAAHIALYRKRREESSGDRSQG